MTDNQLNTANLTANGTIDLSQFEWLFITLGSAHIIFVIIPVLFLGPLILTPFVMNKKLRDSVSIVFMFNIILCTCAPLSYGLLMDINLILNVDIFGPCSGTHNIKSFFVFITYSHLQLLLCNALLTILQSISVRYGTKKVTPRQTLLILFCLFLYSFAGSLLNFVIGVNQTRIRGSLCTGTGSGVLEVGIVITIFYIVPSVLAVAISSFITIRYVKKNTVSRVKTVRRLITIVVIWLVLSIITRSLAVSGSFLNRFISSLEESFIYSFVGYYTGELNYPLFLYLCLFLHTRVRAHLKKIVHKVCFGKETPDEFTDATTTETRSRDNIALK